METESAIHCAKCGVPLKLQKVELVYLGHNIVHEFPVCPICGNLYIPETTVTEKMRKIEQTLEDK